jgi:hypothetical protein
MCCCFQFYQQLLCHCSMFKNISSIKWILRWDHISLVMTAPLITNYVVTSTRFITMAEMCKYIIKCKLINNHGTSMKMTNDYQSYSTIVMHTISICKCGFTYIVHQAFKHVTGFPYAICLATNCTSTASP